MLDCMRRATVLGTAGGVILSMGLAGSQVFGAASDPFDGFTSSRPASHWEEALISGNGTYGALVFGQPLDETIILNHARLYLPLHEPLEPVNTAARLGEIRQLIADGEYQRAADLVVALSHEEGYGSKRWTDPFIPAFDLKIKMAAQGEVRDYRRSVDFSTGVAAVEWRDDRGRFERRLFVSREDDAVVLRITGPGPGTVDCRLELATRPTEGAGGWWPEPMFRDGIERIEIEAAENHLTCRSAFRRKWEGSLQGYEGACRVIAGGGKLEIEEKGLRVRGADEVLLLLRIELLEDFSRGRLAEMRRQLEQIAPDFEGLLRRHVKRHGELFQRCRLDLGGGADREKTSEQLLAEARDGSFVPALVEKQFDACRYAVICSSGLSFPNLQGIWNGTWSPPWSSDFTLNGNVQTAIAANLSANLAECLEPYFRFHETHLQEFRDNAKRLYGCRGIHVPSRASTHGWNNHFDGTWPMTFWTAGAAWASQFFYDYYLYTGDRAFLADRALPFMKEAALFYEDFLVEGPDGKWVFSPSYSPENNPANSPSQACFNAAMDIGAARELLGNCIAACQTLGTEAEAVARWRGLLAKMPEYQINADGAVSEWATPKLEDNYAHRHCSHLYALFNGMPDEIAADERLRQAFHVALDKRLDIRRAEFAGDHPVGEMVFGLVQEGLAATSLRDAEACGEILPWLVSHYWRSNLVTTHNVRSIFNTDLCGGFPAFVIRMLVDSQPGWIELLPAPARQLPAGAIRGVRCRGQVEIVSLTWSADRIAVTLRSEIDQQIELRSPGNPSLPVNLPAEKTIRIELPRKTVPRAG